MQYCKDLHPSVRSYFLFIAHISALTARLVVKYLDIVPFVFLATMNRNDEISRVGNQFVINKAHNV